MASENVVLADRTRRKESNPKGESKPPKAIKAGKPDVGAKDKVPAAPINPNAMFQEGFLASVYNEKPCKPVVTRFPPEPNGFLHIGHSKAIAINFGFARYHGGDCYLRYDDTNPEKEDERYVRSIQEMVEWLGFKPYRITYSSDYFHELYRLAEELVKSGKAYVCHCSDAELKLQRGGADHKGPRYACLHRDRPFEESLSEFRAMKEGRYKPQEAFLRMKQDVFSGNTRMWDLTAYRVLDATHHRTGKEWRIYPTYDFTHCLCDSFEKITHSLCTTEFETSREPYEWLCDALEVYGRLKIQGTVLSKRLIQKLIEAKRVRDFDDPRLFTLVGLRRRGVPPGAILSFVNELGVSTSMSEIQIARFENAVRRYLEQTVPRLMLLLDPLPVIIENLPDDYLEEIGVPFSPKNPEFGDHIVPFTRRVFIDRSDFREVDSKDYFRLAPGKAVGLLKVPFPIRATTFTKDPDTGLVAEVRATYEKPEEGSAFKKPKTYIQWIAASEKHASPVKAEVRYFHNLINLPAEVRAKPEKKTATAKGSKAQAVDAVDAEQGPAVVNADLLDGREEGAREDDAKTAFLEDINPNSEEVFPNAMVEIGLHEVRKRAPWPEEEGEKKEGRSGPETVRFQGLRVAYFCLDKDQSEEGKVVLNRIVSLKEDAGKGA
ncbi:MAG: hypothetical protein M1826_004619 [Phylliscum demangeonii]|nr:MAG: hypothetical protein M1826_004619 [Phylliscum demangeonii]